MAKDTLLNQSNVYALHGVDFMLDDKMNLWFIESNPTPHLGGNTLAKNKIYYKLLRNLFEVQYAYYRSRMKRILDVITRMRLEIEKTGIHDIKKWRSEYQAAVRNRLEPEYRLKRNNSYKIVLDENLEGSDAYFGLISPDCL